MPTYRQSFRFVGLTFLIALTGCSSKSIKKEKEKPLFNRFISAVLVPEKFEPDPYNSMLMAISVKGKRGIKMTDAGLVVAQVLDAAGKVREVSFIRRMAVPQLATGEAWTAFNPIKAKLEPGQYKVCANLADVSNSPPVCASFLLMPLKIDSCYLKFADIQDQVKCECVKGQVRRSGAAHSPLDGFSSVGNPPMLGAYDRFVPPDKITSIFKFEPHFTVRVSDAMMPNECSLEHWKILSAAKCTEGQEVNSVRDGMGSSGPEKFQVFPDEAPFDPRPEAKFDPDGYNEPVTLAPQFAASVGAMAKTHDGDVIHWFDGPGRWAGDFDSLLDIRPTSRKDYFHAWVHGSTGNSADNCDCYFTVRTEVVAANGAIRASTMSAVTGKKCR